MLAHKYEEKIEQLENQVRTLQAENLILVSRKNQIEDKLRLVLFYLDHFKALAAIRWANRIQKSGGILLPNQTVLPLSKKLEQEL